MPFIPLTAGAYQSRTLIAAAQRCLNLYPEPTPEAQGEPFPVAHLCTPGLTFQAVAPTGGCRGLYTAFNGDLYAVFGSDVLHLSNENIWTPLGTMLGSTTADATPKDTPVSMVDNGNLLLIVDGSVDGWFVDLTLPVASQTLTRIDRSINTGFLGADIVSFQDTFFILNSPGTAIYYISLSNINSASLTEAYTVYTATLAPTGTGYSAGDVLTLTGTGGATITVNAVSSGAITSFDLSAAGSSATQPSNPVPVTGGTGTGATFGLTFGTSGANFIVVTATVVPTGINYSAGDVLTLPGTGGGQITANTVDQAGQITQYGVTNGGAVGVQPANPIATTGGTGTGAAFLVQFETNIGGFDPLDFAAMTGQTGEMVAAVSAHRNLWLIGTNSYEIWINTGGDGTATGSFPFAIYYPGAYGNWGCAAKYSIALITNQLFWLSQDKYGQGMIMRADALAAKRISTHSIENSISEYPIISDAIAYTYQQMGHNFYVITFPSANNGRGATWCYDDTTGQWHERCYIDRNGIEYRHLGIAAANAYGNVYVGDWRNDPDNGNLYTFDLTNYTDDGRPIKRLRSFPHQIDLQGGDSGVNRRIFYHQLIAQMQVGSSLASGPTQTAVDAKFDATNGTLLQNYHNINSLGANFTQIDPVNAVILDDAVQAQVTGPVLYSVSGTPTTPNYTVSFTMTPTLYGDAAPQGDDVFIIGRANTSDYGYMASISSNGTQYLAILTVMGGGQSAFVPLGSLTSGSYIVFLSMVAEAITLSVQRSQDAMWVNSMGIWVGQPAVAIAFTDFTYAAAGTILLGGQWGVVNAPVVIPPVVPPTPDPPAPPPDPQVATSGAAAITGIGSLSVIAANTKSLTLPLISVGTSATTGVTSVSVSVPSASVSPHITGVASTIIQGLLTITEGSGALTVPAQAAAAGFHTLTFIDDFTTDTIYPGLGTTLVGGKNWYWNQCVNSPADYLLSPSLTAATIPSTITLTNGSVVVQGNSGGGANASANGGILTFLYQPGVGGNLFNGNFCSVPYNGNNNLTFVGQHGSFSHGYFEAYIQFSPTVVSFDPGGGIGVGNQGTTFYGWPAWWAVGNNDASPSQTNYTELDFMEYLTPIFGPINSTSLKQVTSSVIDWPVPNFSQSDGFNSNPLLDGNWHTYGMLWKSTGSGTGSVTFYMDQQQIGNVVSTGAGHPGQYLESVGSIVLLLGGGNGWPFNVDWVRVWQAP